MGLSLSSSFSLPVWICDSYISDHRRGIPITKAKRTLVCNVDFYMRGVPFIEPGFIV